MSMQAREGLEGAAMHVAAPKARLQRILAAFTVGVPTVGTLVAIADAVLHGLGVHELTLFAVMYLATAVGVEGGLHRYFSHRACRGGVVATRIYGILGSMAGQGPVLFWAAIHRAHHAHSDGPGDPHSPVGFGSSVKGRLRGLWHAHVGWLFEADETDWMKWVPDLLKRREVVRLNQQYFLWLVVGLVVPAAIGGLWAGSLSTAWKCLLWGGLVRMCLVDHATWVVNSLGHTFGRRPHHSGDMSGNIAWLALPSVGGSWHNNHHAFPSLVRNDIEPWQIDIAGYFAELLAALGLVTDLHRPRRFKRDDGRLQSKEGP